MGTHVMFGIKFRSASQRRYILVHEANGKVVIDRRSDSVETIRAERKRLNNRGWSGYEILDTVTGQMVKP